MYFNFVPYKYNPEDRTENDPTHYQVFAAWSLGALCVLYALNELLACRCRLSEFFQELNILNWLQIILTACAIFGPCLESTGCDVSWLSHLFQDYCAGVRESPDTINFMKNDQN